jgi:hypothetical protein
LADINGVDVSDEGGDAVCGGGCFHIGGRWCLLGCVGDDADTLEDVRAVVNVFFSTTFFPAPSPPRSQ